MVIGLTGGIGSGKSTVGHYFQDLGVPVIDADVVARELVEPGRPALAQLAELFGEDILNADGTLNRPRLRALAFSDEAAKERLEKLLHPLIRAEMLRQSARLEAPYCVFVIPLLLEKGWQSMVDRVLVVDASEDEQVRRAMARDGVDEESIRAIMANQVDRKTRLAAADEVIHNEGQLDALRQQVERLHRHYLRLSADRR